MKKFLAALFVVTMFLSACGAKPISTASSTQSPVATEIPTGVSTDDGTVILYVTNNSSMSLDVFWVDGSQEQFYGSVDPNGGTWSISTYPTHVWYVRDASGSLVVEYTATTDKSQNLVVDQSMVGPDVAPCKLPSNGDTVAAGFPVNAYRMPSTGTVRVPVLFADFSDAPATRNPEDVLAIIADAPDFYRVVSYGRLDLQLVPYLQWLRMSKPSTEYDFSTYDGQLAYIREAVALADPEVDFSGATSVYILSNPDATAMSYGPAFTGAPDWGGFSADGTDIYNAATSGNDLEGWGFLWLNHEAYHTMGLPDLYAYQYNADNYDDQHRFVGGFDIMGFIDGDAPEQLAFQRWQLGWLDNDQIFCQQTADATTTISPIETAGGLKAVIIPTGVNTAVVVESRRPLGYDSSLPKSGALVYTIDTSIYSGEGIYNVYPANGSDPYRYQSPLAQGESLTIGNVTVTVIAADNTGDTIQVSVAP